MRRRGNDTHDVMETVSRERVFMEAMSASNIIGRMEWHLVIFGDPWSYGDISQQLKQDIVH